MAKAAERELEAGVDGKPEVALADAGYWNGPQIDALEAKGMEVLVPPDADTRKAPSKIRRGGRYERMRERLARARGRGALPTTPADDRAGLRPDQEQTGARSASRAAA